MNLAGIAFWWDMLGEEKHVGDLAKRLPALPVTPLTPSFKNIAARDIIVVYGFEWYPRNSGRELFDRKPDGKDR